MVLSTSSALLSFLLTSCGGDHPRPLATHEPSPTSSQSRISVTSTPDVLPTPPERRPLQALTDPDVTGVARRRGGVLGGEEVASFDGNDLEEAR